MLRSLPRMYNGLFAHATRAIGKTSRCISALQTAMLCRLLCFAAFILPTVCKDTLALLKHPTDRVVV